MKGFNGVVIRSGLKIGRARKIQPQTWVITRTDITREEVDAEINTLHEAIELVAKDITFHLRSIEGSKVDDEILRTHLMILHDPELIPHISNSISDNLDSAPIAVQKTFSKVLGKFRNMSNEFFAERAADYKDVENRILAAITGQQPRDLDDWQPDEIAVLTESTPSLVSSFARYQIKAYCSEYGSFTSHASILTRSLGITAVAGVQDLFENVRDGDTLILDAIEGHVIVNPDQATLNKYKELLARYLEREKISHKIAKLPTQTLDGRKIKLRCNLDLLSEIDQLSLMGADGIGLYRTEFHYLGKDELPSESVQFEFYREVAEKVSPHSVTIRSFDLGGDKLSHLIPAPDEENPYLGIRGIRFSLAETDIFRTQLRAILRASHFGKVKLLFPMVSDLNDFLGAKSIVEQCQKELTGEGVPYHKDIALGVMIEVPSAALCADELARHCDFLSIGTNDLVQYTLAADRNNSALADYYMTHHPSVLQLMKMTLEAGKKHHKPVSICGEMASQPQYIPLLIGMGFEELSVGPSSFLRSKEIIRRCDAHLTELVQKIDFKSGISTIENLIFKELKPYYAL
jgi:phosphoenolpyruvate-protein phosphotransferase (PTS system enzyme I)